MSKTLPQLPTDYVPFHELVVCGNELIGGKMPIKMNGNVPVLVGKDTAPLIWLSAPVTKDGTEWRPVVARNKSLTKKIIVALSQEDNSVTISTGSVTLIKVEKLTESRATITQLDLRPLGLDVYGDENGISVGTNFYVGNTFEAPAMISIVELKATSTTDTVVSGKLTTKKNTGNS